MRTTPTKTQLLELPSVRYAGLEHNNIMHVQSYLLGLRSDHMTFFRSCKNECCGAISGTRTGIAGIAKQQIQLWINEKSLQCWNNCSGWCGRRSLFHLIMTEPRNSLKLSTKLRDSVLAGYYGFRKHIHKEYLIRLNAQLLALSCRYENQMCKLWEGCPYARRPKNYTIQQDIELPEELELVG